MTTTPGARPRHRLMRQGLSLCPTTKLQGHRARQGMCLAFFLQIEINRSSSYEDEPELTLRVELAKESSDQRASAQIRAKGESGACGCENFTCRCLVGLLAADPDL